ncbi:MAG: DUF721 domain-containing protein [Ectothiorhodospira sp.]
MRAPRTYLDPHMLDHARRLEALTQSVRELLPPDLRGHCWVGNLRDGVLVLVTDGGSWAYPLRYMRREILKQIRDHHGITARTVQIRVQPGMRTFAPSTGHPLPPLSHRARESLQHAAQAVEDPGLKETLRRLASR